MLRFPFDEKKALEALVFVAEKWAGITPFYAAKVFFFAEKDHLNRFGRPIVGDRYIAMENGPVPSIVYDWFKGAIDLMGDPDAIIEALEFNRNGRVVTVTAKRRPDLDYLSSTDVAALESAIAFCQGKTFRQLSDLAHHEPAWQAAPLNAEMDQRLMIDGAGREQAIERAEEFARYGVA